MAKVREQSQQVRTFVLQHAAEPNLASKVVEKFGISRQAANRHLSKLAEDGSLVPSGQTRNRSYKLAALSTAAFTYAIASDLEEDEIWRSAIRPLLDALPRNVLDIWHYAFTEMFNNAIDHSRGTKILVTITKAATSTEMVIMDDGIGIFRNIQDALSLPDEKQAIFELSKGKLTTDARNHSGQGIFFTSRMVNAFDILSGGVYFGHELGREFDWLADRDAASPGTTVFLKVDNKTTRTVKKVYAQYSVHGSFGFNKTVVPVKLAKYGSDQLVSRSQAKRVLVRVDQFSQVIFDFTDVDMVGQAFADQIFRVFASEHPEVELIPSHANADIMGLIQASVKAARPGFKGQ